MLFFLIFVKRVYFLALWKIIKILFLSESFVTRNVITVELIKKSDLTWIKINVICEVIFYFINKEFIEISPNAYV